MRYHNRMPNESAIPATKADISMLKGDISILRSDMKVGMAIVTTDVATLKTDVVTLKTDVATLKTDVATLKTDVAILKIDVSAIKTDIVRLDQKIDRVAVALVKTQADVREIRHDMATKDDVKRILNAIDAFAKKSEHNDRAILLHGHVLTEVQIGIKDHERRLKTIESARP